MQKRIGTFIVVMTLIIGAFSSAHALSSYATVFKAKYPSSPLSSLSTQSGVAGNLCTLCHGASGGSRNTFGSNFASSTIGNHTFNATLEARDSDTDGFTNLAEITAGTFPGNAASKPASAACTSYTYSAWTACQSNNTQTRTVLTSLPSGCTGGVAPVTSQACTYVPPVTACTSYTYTVGACQSNNTAPVTSYTGIPAGCSGGATPATTQPCTYVPPVTACTSYTYSAWSACQSNNTQTRTVLTSVPAGCTGGVAPVTSQACTYVPPVTACTSYTYTVGACQSNNTAPVTSYTGIPAGCSGGATPATTQPCTYVPPVTACTSYTYSAWSACQSNNTQTRTVVTSMPAGCSGGAATLTSQACTYVPPVAGALISPSTSDLVWDDVNKLLGIGTMGPKATIHISENDGSNPSRGLLNAQHHNGTTAAAFIQRKSRGTEANPSAALTDDAIGAMHFEAFDGSQYQSVASIRSIVSGPVQTGSVPGDLWFHTGENSTSTFAAPKMVITTVGDIGIGTTEPVQRLEVNGGIKLNPDPAVEPKPVCNADTRGTFWFTQDDVNGDRADVCARVSGSYSWRRLF